MDTAEITRLSSSNLLSVSQYILFPKTFCTMTRIIKKSGSVTLKGKITNYYILGESYR